MTFGSGTRSKPKAAPGSSRADIRAGWLALIIIMIGCAITHSALSNTKILHFNHWSTWGHAKDNDGYVLNAQRSPSSQHYDIASIASALPEQPKSYESIFVEFSPDKYKGKKIRFTASIKTAKVIGSANAWISANAQHKIVCFDDMGKSGLKGTMDWQPVSLVISVPERTETMRAGFTLRGGGEAYFKSPKVEVVENDVAATEQPLTPGCFMEKMYALTKYPANLDFTDDRTTYSSPENCLTNWAVHSDHGFVAILDRKTTWQGKPTVRLSTLSKNPKGFLTIYQTFSANEFRGKRVRWSAWVKTADVPDWDALFMQVDGRDRPLYFDAMEDRPIKGTRNWKTYSAVLDVPAEAEKIKIGFLHSGGGTAWVNNCKVECVDTTVKSTGVAVKNERLPSAKPNGEPEFDFD